jgi:hypothetical protein
VLSDNALARFISFQEIKYLQKFASFHASLKKHSNSERQRIDREISRTQRSAAMGERQHRVARNSIDREVLASSGSELATDCRHPTTDHDALYIPYKGKRKRSDDARAERVNLRARFDLKLG